MKSKKTKPYAISNYKSLLVLAIGLMVLLPTHKAHAQVEVLEVIKAGVKKVIKAVDLKIQRMQNKTIWLQNAQKLLENELSGLKLTEIGEWVERQRSLYGDYYEELWKIKAAVAYYHRVKEVTDKQGIILKEYKQALGLIRSTDVFSATETAFMEDVYEGILLESVDNATSLLNLVKAFSSQMEDAERLELIDHTAIAVAENLDDLRQFNRKIKQLFQMRSKEKRELDDLKKWYGIN